MTELPVGPVRSAHVVDEEALFAYLKPLIPDLQQPEALLQFRGGQSNPTYLIKGSKGAFVLRKKPPGKLLPSAHQVEREARVMTALFDTPVPVPRVRHLCEDTSIIGTSFFVMDFVAGRVVTDPSLTEINKADRAAWWTSAMKTLGALHSVDIDAVGLGDFGKRGGYVRRQRDRWTKQYRSSETKPIEAMEQLIAFLDDLNVDDEITTLAHGDFRLGNLMFNDEGEVNAVLDWELATLGHPLADLAYLLMPYYLPHQTPDLGGVLGLDLQEQGLLPMDELVSIYEAAGGAKASDLKFFSAFSFFRLAAICQGVYRRALDGNAADAKAKGYGAAVELLAGQGCLVANQTSSSSSSK